MNDITYTIVPAHVRKHARKQITDRQSANETLRCDVPGCGAKRRGISRFCKYHQDRHQETGHPVLKTPRGKAFEAALEEADEMLAWLRTTDDWKNVDMWLSRAARFITVKPSMMLPPRKIDPKMTRRTRAYITLAWAMHGKAKVSADQIVKNVLAFELWTQEHDRDYGETTRLGFVHRCIGGYLHARAYIREDRTQYRVRYERTNDATWNPTTREYDFKQRRVEEEVPVTDRYRMPTSVWKTLGKIMRGLVDNEVGGLREMVRAYRDHRLVMRARKAELELPQFDDEFDESHDDDEALS